MPITDFLSCTRVFDEFESLSPAQRRHAKTYATGLVAVIAREVLPANSKRALNKFFTEYDWDEDHSIMNGSKSFRNMVKRAGRKTADLMEEIDHLFVHSTAD